MKYRALLWLLVSLSFSVCKAAASPDFVLQDLGHGVWAAISSDAGKAFANAGFVIGDNAVLVIDTFQDPEPAKSLLAEIRKRTPLPIRYVINTHYHIDHVNGDDVFAAAGALLIAQRNVRTWIRTENLKFWNEPIPADVRHRVQTLPLPDLVYDDHITLYLGSRAVEVRAHPGHTGGDSVVFIPDADVTFCGDLLWKNHYPNLIDATTSLWIRTLAQLQRENAVFVPGHGPVAGATDVAAFRRYLIELRTTIERKQKQGKSGSTLVSAVVAELRTSRKNWAFFDDYARDDISQTVAELDGRKRLPQLAAK